MVFLGSEHHVNKPLLYLASTLMLKCSEEKRSGVPTLLSNAWKDRFKESFFRYVAILVASASLKYKIKFNAQDH